MEVTLTFRVTQESLEQYRLANPAAMLEVWLAGGGAEHDAPIGVPYGIEGDRILRILRSWAGMGARYTVEYDYNIRDRVYEYRVRVGVPTNRTEPSPPTAVPTPIAVVDLPAHRPPVRFNFRGLKSISTGDGKSS